MRRGGQKTNMSLVFEFFASHALMPPASDRIYFGFFLEKDLVELLFQGSW